MIPHRVLVEMYAASNRRLSAVIVAIIMMIEKAVKIIVVFLDCDCDCCDARTLSSAFTGVNTLCTFYSGFFRPPI